MRISPHNLPFWRYFRHSHHLIQRASSSPQSIPTAIAQCHPEDRRDEGSVYTHYSNNPTTPVCTNIFTSPKSKWCQIMVSLHQNEQHHQESFLFLFKDLSPYKLVSKNGVNQKPTVSFPYTPCLQPFDKEEYSEETFSTSSATFFIIKNQPTLYPPHSQQDTIKMNLGNFLFTLQLELCPGGTSSAVFTPLIKVI